MSALTVDHVRTGDHEYEWDELVRIRQETEVPEGCTVEIIEGIVTVVPPPSNVRNLIAGKVQRQLYEVVPDDWNVHQTRARLCLRGRNRSSHPGYRRGF